MGAGVLGVGGACGSFLKAWLLIDSCVLQSGEQRGIFQGRRTFLRLRAVSDRCWVVDITFEKGYFPHVLTLWM